MSSLPNMADYTLQSFQINGELVAQSTPEEVVEKLKAAQGYVHLVIRRELVGQ